jgi:ubiquinone/menaquinone biosynthesis C-methylase UbiE
MNDYLSKENYEAPSDDFFKEHFQVANVFERHKDKMFGKCADFGCNSGGCTVWIANKNDIVELIAIDINEKALRKLEARKLPKIYCLLNNLIELKVADNTFDSAYSFHTLEHIYPDDLDKVVSEFHRTMKPNSYILLNIPYGNAYGNKQHVSKFDVENLSELFKRNGFEITECIKDVNDTLTLLAKNIK